jgi:hypothetical protein
MHIVQSLRIPYQTKVEIAKLLDPVKEISDIILSQCREINNGNSFNYVIPRKKGKQVLHTVTLPFDRDGYVAGMVLEELAKRNKTNSSNIIKSMLLSHFTPDLVDEEDI